ncbi:MmcQ/YjbR family DNA-binding protein [Sneathiella sp.]|uniref:MmcQ/YjbR family DNA-binding protein n=1 Tax=Sneathiella sp. TaxID=1964365 RepID=UPI003566F354
MMRDEFDSFCGSFPAATNTIQWGNASVWKIGGKIFAVCSHWGPGTADKISFKCTDLSYAVLTEQESIIPAPYLARAKWVQLQSPTAMTDRDVRLYIQKAYSIVKGKLTKVARADLGI